MKNIEDLAWEYAYENGPDEYDPNWDHDSVREAIKEAYIAGNNYASK